MSFNSSRVEGWHLNTHAIAWAQIEKSRGDKSESKEANCDPCDEKSI